MVSIAHANQASRSKQQFAAKKEGTKYLNSNKPTKEYGNLI